MERTSSDSVHTAVMRRNLSGIVSSIEAGAEVDERDRDGRTPLFYAAQDGEYDIVVELLERGADVNAVDKALKTPLHFAAIHYQPYIADLLLRRGARVDSQDANGNTALFDAVFNADGRGEVIENLLAFGAERSIKNNHGISPEDLAVMIRNYDILKHFS